jgi:amino acid permease
MSTTRAALINESDYGAALINDASVQELPQLKRKRGNALVDGCSAALTLANSALGAGILSYPFAFMSAGVAGASIATAFMGFCSFVSLACIMRLMAIARETSLTPVSSYGDLVRFALGDTVAGVVEILVVFYCFGACVGYIVLLGDVFTPLVLKVLPNFTKADTLHLLVEVGCTGLAFLLCLLRRISALKYTAVLAVAATFGIVGMLIHQVLLHPCDASHCSDEHHASGWPLDNYGGGWMWPEGFSGLFRAFPLIAFAMQCHMQCAIVYCEMPARISQAPGRRQMVALAAVLLLLVMYFPTGIAGFMRFGKATQGDILQNFVVADGLADMARVCIGLTALASFPLQHFPARAAIDAFWRRRVLKTGSSGSMSCTFLLVEALIWVSSSLGLAILAGSQLALVFQLVGAIAGSAVILLIPGALWAIRGNGASCSFSRLFPAVLLIIAGLFILITGTMVTLEQMFVAGNATAANATMSIFGEGAVPNQLHFF